jgi:hypothetical protein
MNAFRKRPGLTYLSREERVRQGRIVNVAQAALADFASVRTFLNSHNEQLGGRPIDVAIASAAGFDAAEAAVKRHAAPPQGAPL